jgi:hypothetical protein
MNKQIEIRLEATFSNGAKYSFYGSTKKEALTELKNKFGNAHGLILKYTTEQI